MWIWKRAKTSYIIERREYISNNQLPSVLANWRYYKQAEIHAGAFCRLPHLFWSLASARYSYANHRLLWGPIFVKRVGIRVRNLVSSSTSSSNREYRIGGWRRCPKTTRVLVNEDVVCRVIGKVVLINTTPTTRRWIAKATRLACTSTNVRVFVIFLKFSYTV